MKSAFDALKFMITLKVWRNMNGLTQRDVGELTKIPTSTYAFIENGDRPPTMAEFTVLASLMSFEPCDFLKTPEKAKNGK